MNPSKAQCESALEAFRGEVIAMSVLAGGFVKPQEAREYIVSLPRIKSMVVGMSSKAHVDQIFQLYFG